MTATLDAVRAWGRTVKLSHTLFALPFALSGAALAAAESGITAGQLGWIVVAMFGARNSAMGFNRLADHEIDASNPRTAQRELPAGRLARRQVWTMTVALAALFVFAAFRLGPLCGWLSPVALAVIFAYSYTKRFTWASHFALGLGLALAPIGGWLAVAGTLDPVALWLGATVLLWVAGFDVVYACQDVEFDRRAGLYSLPVRIGVGGALAVARWLHAAALTAMAAVGVAARLRPAYWLGWGAIALLLLSEHRLVRRDDLSQVGIAFFNRNAAIGAVYLAAILAGLLL